MEGHAAFPHPDDVERVLKEMQRIVEEHIAQPSAQDNAERGPGEQIVRLPGCKGWLAIRPQGWGADQALGVPNGEDKSGNIRQCVPTHGEGAN